ncbi:MAG: HEPN domain-containing protein [Elusimicrobiota bacterium]|nr:HEPN domain-containing protein [Elusimicrobiota bacterium]
MARVELAKYRIDKAKGILREAEDSLKQKHYGLTVNRSYYVMFTASRSLLAILEMDSGKHSGVIAMFNRHVVKNGLFPKELSRLLKKEKRNRENFDYGDFVEITAEEAAQSIEYAKKFLKEAEKVLKKMLKDLKT